MLLTKFHSVRVTNKPQNVSNAAYNFPGSYSATGITNWVTQQTWLDCFYGFVSLAVQRLPKIFIPTFPVPRFLLPRYISVLWDMSMSSVRCCKMQYGLNIRCSLVLILMTVRDHWSCTQRYKSSGTQSIGNHMGSHVIVVFVFSQANCPSKSH